MKTLGRTQIAVQTSLLIHLGLALGLFVVFSGPFLPKTQHSLIPYGLVMEVSSRSVQRLKNTFKASPLRSQAHSQVTQDSLQTSQAMSLPVGRLDGVQVDLKERYLFEFRTWIEKYKQYPPLAHALGQSGKVEVTFKVLKDGQLENIRVTGPSAFERLNRAALELLEKAAQFKPLPEELKQSELVVTLPIVYELN